MVKNVAYVARYAVTVGLLLLFSGCGDTIHEVSVSVKTIDNKKQPLRYVQFSLNDKGMITNKDGVKLTKLSLKEGIQSIFNWFGCRMVMSWRIRARAVSGREPSMVRLQVRLSLR